MFARYRVTVHLIFMHRHLVLFTFFLFIAQHNYASFQEIDEFDSDLLFSTNDPINVSLTSNFKKLFDDRGEDRGYHKAWISYLNNNQDTIVRKVKLRTRGNFRRDPANCKYPPIRVKFGNPITGDSLFKDQTKLKLVIQCQIEKYVLLEYLAYRIHNVLTDSSYRVRLSHITYTDDETKEIYATKYGFFIESQDQLGERLNADDYKKHVVQYLLDRRHVITMALFQYLIGNNDWYITSKHNITVLQDKDNNEFLGIPYDFDWSKLVDASYTKPVDAPDHLLKDRRLYKGLCMTESEFEEQQKHFNDNREEIMKLVQEIPNLTTKERRQTTSFIQQFYKTINKPGSLSSIFQKEECVHEHDLSIKKKPD